MKADEARHVVRSAFRGTYGAWLHIAVFSAAVNVLMLTGSLYMMQVYDRVLSSRSIATLLAVSAVALVAYALQGWLDHVRLKMLGRIGASIDVQLSPYVLCAATSIPLKSAGPAASLQPHRDLAALRGFLASLGPTALLDMPFAPLFLLICFVLHPWLGWTVVGGTAVILALTVLTERRAADPARSLSESGAAQSALLEAGRRNAETIRALGMGKAFAASYEAAHQRHLNDGLALSEGSGSVSSFAKTFRFILQSAVLGVGAYLVIRGEMSGGGMLAASILSSRALAPIELAVAHLKSFLAARDGYRRLSLVLPEHVARAPSLALPAPAKSLHVEDVVIGPPGVRQQIVAGVSFELSAGAAMGLIGPSGSGKSSLARGIVGIWQPLRGMVRLDGASIRQWDPDHLGRSIGFLPQDVELLPGTVAANIARFIPDATDEKVLAAARAAGAHEMIVAFTDGYDTLVGEGGAALSGGQRQRIALARALYGDPFLVVLDEPNSSLDAQGDAALATAILGVKERGGIVVVITHRPSGLAGVDLVGLMVDGRLRAFGPKDEVLAAATAQTDQQTSQPAHHRTKGAPGARRPDLSDLAGFHGAERLGKIARAMREAADATPPPHLDLHQKAQRA